MYYATDHDQVANRRRKTSPFKTPFKTYLTYSAFTFRFLKANDCKIGLETL